MLKIKHHALRTLWIYKNKWLAKDVLVVQVAKQEKAIKFQVVTVTGVARVVVIE